MEPINEVIRSQASAHRWRPEENEDYEEFLFDTVAEACALLYAAADAMMRKAAGDEGTEML